MTQSRAQALVERVSKAWCEEAYPNPHTEACQSAADGDVAFILRVVVEDLGITWDMVDQAEIGGWYLKGAAERGEYWADEVDDEESRRDPDPEVAQAVVCVLSDLLQASGIER